MGHMDQVEDVRRQVRAELVKLGASQDDGLLETILIRDGHYCGRRFRMDDFQATWFLEENEIKYYGRDGAVLQTIAVGHQVALDPNPSSLNNQSNGGHAVTA